MCVCFLISEVVIIKKGEIVEAKLHGESKVIQRCFDDNNDDNKRWRQRWWQKAQRSIKNNSRVQDKNQEEFKTQEESLKSRIKIQGSRCQESRSRFKNQKKTQSR